MKKLSLSRFIKRPVDISILDDWARIANDIAKAAIIALPGPIFYYDKISAIAFSVIGLLIVAITMLIVGVACRQTITNRKEK